MLEEDTLNIRGAQHRSTSPINSSHQFSISCNHTDIRRTLSSHWTPKFLQYVNRSSSPEPNLLHDLESSWTRSSGKRLSYRYWQPLSLHDMVAAPCTDRGGTAVTGGLTSHCLRVQYSTSCIVCCTVELVALKACHLGLPRKLWSTATRQR